MPTVSANCASEPKIENAAPASRRHGRLDIVSPALIAGWVWDTAAPGGRVALRISLNGIQLGRVVADRHRADLEQAGIGDGHHSFVVRLPAGLAADARHMIRVQHDADGADLPGSPWRLGPAAIGPAPTGPAPTGPAPTGSVVPEDAPVLTLPDMWHGHLDTANRERVRGWAWDGLHPDTPAHIEILDNGEVIARLLANRYRDDLAQSGIGDGRHGFEFVIPGRLCVERRHLIQVRNAADGRELRGSPQVIESAGSFDEALQARVANAIEALQPGPAQERALAFIVAQADRVLQLRAEAEGQVIARRAHRHFLRRWGLADEEVADPGPRTLVIDDTLPDPGSPALLSHMSALQRLGYTVSFVASLELNRPAAAFDRLTQSGIACCSAPYYASVEEVLRRQTQCFDVIYLHRIASAAKYLSLARQYCPQARILYSVAELHHLHLARQAAVEAQPEKLAESRRMQLAECTAAWSADAVLVHSPAEAAWLRHAVPEAQVHVVPWALPERPTRIALSQRRGVAFIGDFAQQPDADAARFLAEEIMPLVWRDQSIECLLIGSNPPAAIARLARPGLAVLGAVADPGAIFDRVRLTVAPFRYGAGIKGNVLSSLAAGVPAVLTPLAAEGLNLDAAPLGADAAGLASQILRLHAGGPDYAQAAAAGRTMIATQWTKARVDDSLRAAIDGGGASPWLRSLSCTCPRGINRRDLSE